MAPDPPREDRHQEHRDVDEIDGDDETLQPGTFVVDWSAIGEGDVGEGGDDDDDDELMFVPQGPHELDMGSGSEYSSDDDDEDDNNGDQARNNLAEEGASSEHSRGNLSSSSSSSARGHYQMLIPFPPSQMLESSDGEDIINGTVVEGIAAPARVIISGAVSEERDGLDNANNSAAISAANSQVSIFSVLLAVLYKITLSQSRNKKYLIFVELGNQRRTEGNGT